MRRKELRATGADQQKVALFLLYQTDMFLLDVLVNRSFIAMQSISESNDCTWAFIYYGA